MSLLSAEALAAYTNAGFWRGETIYATAARHAKNTPDSSAARDRRRRLTYRELIAAADMLSADLAARGVRAGQRVAIWLPSSVEMMVALLACWRNGYVCCPSLHRDHTVGEVRALIERMDAAAVIAQPGYGADADRHELFSAIEGLPSLRHAYRLVPDTVDRKGLPFEDLVADPTAVPAEPNRDPNRIIYLPFTSGTTGAPKGVMHSDNTLLASARALAEDWHFDARSRVYILSPLSHNLGLGAFISGITVGGELIVHDLPKGRRSVRQSCRDGSHLPVRSSHACHRSAERVACPTGHPPRIGDRLSHLRRGGAAAGAVGVDASRDHAAKRLRDDGDLLPSVHAADGRSGNDRGNLRPFLRRLRSEDLASG